MRSGRELSRYLQPPLPAERIDKQWEGVVRREDRSSRKRLQALGAGLALALATTLVVLFLRATPATVAVEGTVVETSAANAQPLLLADGSRVEVAQGSRLSLVRAGAREVHLVLSRGATSLEVTHVPDRPFVVSAGDWDVRVRGTKFRVELTTPAASAVRVSVTEGRVEVLRTGTASVERSVSAGETWSSDRLGPGGALPPAARFATAPPAAFAGSLREREQDGGGRRGIAREGVTPEAAHEAKAIEAPKDDSVHHRAPPEEMDARKLLEIADAARLAGHPEEAAQALDKIRLQHRADPRAGLAALELGRLRMDALGDARGALQAIDDALRLSRSAAIREDAEARRVRILELLGDRAACERARDEYLRAFPAGIHTASVRGRCGAK